MAPDKASVLQEVKAFHSAASIPARKASVVLTQLLIILNQDQVKPEEVMGRITNNEANDAFFAITKLFQNKDAFLRRLIYVCIKELVISSPSIDAIIVTSSLIRDMTGPENAYRAPAIRALWRIADPSMIGSIERYMKHVIVHKDSDVSSSALVCAYWMSERSPILNDGVRRWTSEVTEALRQHQNKQNCLVQYHAIALLCKVRHMDRLAMMKLVLGSRSRSSKNQFADVINIRLAANLVATGLMADEPRMELIGFIESCLRYKGDMVAFEAAKTLVTIENLSSEISSEAVNVLRSLLDSKKPVSRFAAVRALSDLSNKNPSLVGSSCNLDLEPLVSSQNRLIATFAITILLKTESEGNIEGLIKQLSGFMSDINDEFRTNVVGAIKTLCQKYPNKQITFMKFLNTLIREEGGVDFKSAIVDCIISIIEQNAAAREVGLSSLCEFIEDCDQVPLATRILHLIGQLGAKDQSSSRTVRKYVRYIYNRIMLEPAPVRAAAITALTKLALSDPSVVEPVMMLIQRSAEDPNDDVQQRAAFSIQLLSQKDTSAAERIFSEIGNVPFFISSTRWSSQNNSRVRFDELFVAAKSPTALTIGAPLSSLDSRKGSLGSNAAAASGQGFGSSGLCSRSNQSLLLPDEVQSVLEDDKVSFKCCPSIELTEEELEYTVRCIKHVYREHLVLQFIIRNTLDDISLRDVSIVHESISSKLYDESGERGDQNEDDYSFVFKNKCDLIGANDSGVVYTVIHIPDSKSALSNIFRLQCCMHFKVDDGRGAAGADSSFMNDDQLTLDSVETSLGDFLKEIQLSADLESMLDEIAADPGIALDELNPLSDQLGGEFMASEIFVFSNTSVEQIATAMTTDTFNLKLLKSVMNPNKLRFSALMSGLFRTGERVAVAIRLAADSDSVHMKLICRSESEEVVAFVLSAVNA